MKTYQETCGVSVTEYSAKEGLAFKATSVYYRERKT